MKRLVTLLLAAVLSLALAVMLPTESVAEAEALLNVHVQKSNDVLLLVWEQVPNNYGYNVKVDGVSVGNVAANVTRFDLTALLSTAKSYGLSVAALDENDAPTEYATITFEHYIELKKPTELAVADGVLSWRDENVGAGYAVFANGIKIGNNITEKQFNLSNLLAYGGVFDITVQALAVGNYTLSKVSDVYRFTNYLKLAKPENAAVSVVNGDKVLSWQRVFGADSYHVVISKADGVVTLSQTVTECSLVITDAVSDVTDYDVSVTAVGQNYRSDSDAAVISYGTHATLAAPALSVSDKTVKWAAVANALSYSVSINGTPVATELTATSYDFTAHVAEVGRYEITVQANANGNYSQSTIASKTYFTYVRLASPALLLDGSVLSWAAVPNAVNYTVTLDGGVLDNLYTAISIDLALYCAEVKDYAVTVSANATGYYTASDEAAVTYSVTAKLATTTVELDGTTARWAAVFGATSYTVKVDDTVVSSDCTATELDLSTYLTGSHTVSVFANANGNFEASDAATATYTAPVTTSSYTITNTQGERLAILDAPNVEYAVFMVATDTEATRTNILIDGNNKLTGSDLANAVGKTLLILQTNTDTSASVYYVESFVLSEATAYLVSEASTLNCEDSTTGEYNPKGFTTEGEGVYEVEVDGNWYCGYINGDGTLYYNEKVTAIGKRYSITA